MFGQKTDTKTKPTSDKSHFTRSELQAKLKIYNDYFKGKKQQIITKEIHGEMMLEGPLLIHWRVQSCIKLVEKDESQASKENWRHSYTMAMCNGLDDDLLQKMNKSNLTRRSSLTGYLPCDTESENVVSTQDLTKSHRGIMREKARRRQRHRRLSIINGHIFDVETSIFTPAFGSVTSVNVTSMDPVPAVITQLLNKFKVKNNPADFCLCVVRSNGEVHVLRNSDFPLLIRVFLGPFEDVAKLFIMDKGRAEEVNEEVAQYVNLPEPVLKGFLEKIKLEEETELINLKERYRQLRKNLEQCLSEFHSTNL